MGWAGLADPRPPTFAPSVKKGDVPKEISGAKKFRLSTSVPRILAHFFCGGDAERLPLKTTPVARSQVPPNP